MGFLGMRDSDDFVTSANPRYTWRPESWREAILYLWPNGMAPLTAIMSKMSSEETSDPVFHWFSKSLPEQSGAVTGIYTDSGLSTPYSSSGAAGNTLYVKMALATIEHFKPGHVVLLRDASDSTMNVVARVSARTDNGASSYLTVVLLEADDNSSTGDLSDCDRILIIGSAYEEGADIPSSISYDPTQYENYTQIFRTSLDITRTARKTRIRTGDQYKEMKREALQLHSIEQERAYIFGVKYAGTGANGRPLRTTMGIWNWIKTYAPTNVDDYTLNADYHGQTWISGGKAWLDSYLEQLFRYGSEEKLAFCGSGALLGIQKLVWANGSYNISVKEKAFGISVTEWITPFGVVNIKTHPLFSLESSLRNSMMIIEPKHLKYRYIDDTFFKKDNSEREGGYTAYDLTREEYLTEAGLEFHHPSVHGILNGVGVNHS